MNNYLKVNLILLSVFILHFITLYPLARMLEGYVISESNLLNGMTFTCYFVKAEQKRQTINKYKLIRGLQLWK